MPLQATQSNYANSNTIVRTVTNVLPDCYRQVNRTLPLGSKVCEAQAL